MPEQSTWDIVVVGAGIAGIAALKGIRDVTQTASVCLINGEARLPYKRTKLSKNIASGFERDAFALFDPQWYTDNRIDVLHGKRVQNIRPDRHALDLVGGQQIGWGTLILATGATPRRTGLMPANTPGAFVVRAADDADKLSEHLNTVKTVAVIGMGVLGVEVAEQACLAGKQVTLVNRGSAMMGRDLNATASEILRSLFEKHGVELRFNTVVQSVKIGPAGALTLDIGGEKRVFDAVVECVGSAPNVELAREAGLGTEVGIVVDTCLRTTSPDVLAAGDCAQFPEVGAAHLWHTAESQGYRAGANAAGEVTPYDAKPYRLKCEPFGAYFFSMSYLPPQTRPKDVASFETRTADLYQCFYMRDAATVGAVMAGDKARTKTYEKAVWEGWTRDQIQRDLPNPTV
ncbi:MAG: FAD-dependent oxidoreductase [Lentisphaerae bacterium]|jgi:NAD(P)H-nitrite reductase large subunit|nr:FAD-dependent oxidoreductase [Lentisphaerota bacterium]MBT4817795.1 FAD-dependent oxidoreductase [Lentisphaerota bacterium]MBT5612122.1 FAD-dependent oxidoreductase [Lentisphaerota bacterium]MBT7058779.1 FAD-dependent oxidoreductase [Lentisphaerota bacterium]